ncbi:amidohydrolase family protein [Massilia antarctica]|uniref:Amidohydrolase family protein n=1 Tax=Massilia antarctica TaxID=2765360 RepID=A0AA49A9Q3_9BURK|nr:amidohydrolase family protein [Massilia antarctica]QPI50885.1 amidohydrolase family protein [Massilia antarctica]
MIYDGHFHLRRKRLAFTETASTWRGCVVSRSNEENPACLAFARQFGHRCALFSGRGKQQAHWLLDLIEHRQAVAYKHLELSTADDTGHLMDLCRVSAAAGVPMVLHLSRHDTGRFDERDAERHLAAIVERFSDLKLLVSHLGGENFRTVLHWARRHKNIFIDTSCLSETAARANIGSATDLLTLIKDTVDVEQLVYGSDACWSASEQRASDDLGRVERIFSGAEMEKIKCANGVKLLNDFL